MLITRPRISFGAMSCTSDVTVENTTINAAPVRNSSTSLTQSVRDPSFADYSNISQLPAHVMRQIRRFFEDYKVLENKKVIVDDLLGPDDAVKIILEAMDLYGKLRRGELQK